MRWAYSALLPVALLLLALTVVVAGSRPQTLEIRVASSTSGEAMPGALVTVGETLYRSDEEGRVVVERPAEGATISARVEGFSEVGMPVRESGGVRTIQLQPALVAGVVSDADDGAPVAGAEIVLRSEGGGEDIMTHTDRSGRYVFKNVPEQAVLSITSSGYMPVEVRIGAEQQLPIALEPSAEGERPAHVAVGAASRTMLHIIADWTGSGGKGRVPVDLSPPARPSAVAARSGSTHLYGLAGA